MYYEYTPYKQSNEDKCKVKYSHQRVKQILLDDFHIALDPVYTGYKGNRRRGFVEHYKMRLIDSGEFLVESATLNAIRIELQKMGYPLHAPEEPNQGAVDFLAYVNKAKQQRKEQ